MLTVALTDTRLSYIVSGCSPTLKELHLKGPDRGTRGISYPLHRGPASEVLTLEVGTAVAA